MIDDVAGRFASRPTHPLGVATHRAWRIKWYGITVAGTPLDDRLRAAAGELVTLAVPAPPPGEPGVGFAILHQGAEAVWLLLDLWSGDIVSQLIWRAPLDQSDRFEPVPAGGPTACVWELVVHGHERHAYVRHVLDRPDDPDAEGYLADTVTVEPGAVDAALTSSPSPAPPPSPSPAPSPGVVPTLRTERLVLRAIGADDFEPMARFYADPVSRFYGGPRNRDDAWRKFAAYPGHWALRGYGPWAIERRDTGEFIGITGLWFPEEWPEPEITWALLPEHHGRGFATEGADAALEAAYRIFGWTTAVSVIAKDNHPSAAVARRLGAHLERETEYRYGTADLFRHRPPGQRS